jgi:hypothetical protein
MTKFVWNGGGDFRPEGATKAVKWVDREDLATDTAVRSLIYLLTVSDLIAFI